MAPLTNLSARLKAARTAFGKCLEKLSVSKRRGGNKASRDSIPAGSPRPSDAGSRRWSSAGQGGFLGLWGKIIPASSGRASASSDADAPHALPASGSTSSKSCIGRSDTAARPSADSPDIEDQLPTPASAAVKQQGSCIDSSNSISTSPFIKACWGPAFTEAGDSSSNSGISSLLTRNALSSSGSLCQFGSCTFMGGRCSSISSSVWLGELEISSSHSSCSSWIAAAAYALSSSNDSSSCWLDDMVCSSRASSMCQLGNSFTALTVCAVRDKRRATQY
uniref:Uncharacterized protein n=1 Tax=Tetradesmus obliquus TaxID=3088 RepID=A0A383VY24_TETOB